MTLPVLAVALLYGALELAALLLFLRPYAHQGLARRCDSPSRRALRLLFCVAMAFAFAALRVGQSLPGMVLNILLHFAAVALTGFTLYDLPLTQMLNSSLVFHLSLDMCKSLLWDMLPFLKSFRTESGALDQLMLTLPLMALQALCCLALRQTACAPHDRRMNRTMAALIFLPAVPYLYVKSLQYRSFMIGDVSYSGAMSALCFLVCLLAVAVSLLSNRLVAGIDRERRAEHEHMTLERLEAQMAQHQQQIDNINKLSHDMRNHLATLAAMGGSKEAADYIAALTHRFAPVAVRKISGCPVLDVLLAQKMDECSRVGASLIPCISQEAIGALCALSGPDLCTLYGNLLDNAIEAVSALPDGEDKTVTLRTNLRGSLLVIRTENRYQGERRHAGGGFSTTKADANAHGYGLRSVRDCVHHLGGEMTLSDENRLFVVNVLLPAAGG
mgnify:FL=1